MFSFSRLWWKGHEPRKCYWKLFPKWISADWTLYERTQSVSCRVWFRKLREIPNKCTLLAFSASKSSLKGAPLDSFVQKCSVVGYLTFKTILGEIAQVSCEDGEFELPIRSPFIAIFYLTGIQSQPKVLIFITFWKETSLEWDIVGKNSSGSIVEEMKVNFHLTSNHFNWKFPAY